MALTSKIPPQAYTRDTLVKAIEWLSSQPSDVRARATSADLIVSHYLQARRQHAASAYEHAPISQESFKSDLRHLAQDLKQFEEPPAPSQPAPQVTPSRAPSYVRPEAEEQLETIVSHHRQDNLFRHELTRQERIERTPEPQVRAPEGQVRVTETTTTVKGLAWNVDQRSLAIARQLQETLNLSSEGEALRMLVTLGAERVKGLIA